MAITINKIMISQPKPATEKSPYYDIQEKLGVEIDFRPFFRIEALSAKDFRQQRIYIQDYSAVIFTARMAIDYFFQLCEELRVAIPETLKYFCTSESVATYLHKYIVYRKRKVFYPQSGKLEDMCVQIVKHQKESFLVPVADVHKEDLFEILQAKKINYAKEVLIRSVSNEFTNEEIQEYDMIVFFSPSGISSLFQNIPEFEQGDKKIGCFGQGTAKAVKEAGLRLDLEAPTVECPSMAAALERFLTKD